jgi:signal transduction histidine kinase
MLLKKEESDKNIKRLKRIELASATLKTLYRELDYLIKKQTHTIEKEVCDLKNIIENRIQSYRELFSQIDFTFTLESSSVKIDTIGFLKVLDNLIHNAVKYSGPNSVVSIELREMQLSIKDEGVGMDEDFIFKAFEHYFQEDASQKGQGIGLGLVKEYCDSNKISIYVDSKKDQGTKITLDLRSVSAGK